MDARSIFHSIGRVRENHGISAAAYDTAIRGLNKCFYFRSLRCVEIEDVNRRCLELPSGFRFEKLQASELPKSWIGADFEMNPEFIRGAVEKGDECCAILEGDRLASYGWYSHSPTLLDNEDLLLRFDADYVYMYKGFTLPAYRGQRLHAFGMTRALAAYKSMGYKGLVSYVESNNFDSLRSCYRMGYRDCGIIRLAQFAGRYVVQRNPSCERHGLDIEVRGSRNSAKIAEPIRAVRA